MSDSILFPKLAKATQELYGTGFVMKGRRLDTWVKKVGDISVTAFIEPVESNSITKGVVKALVKTDAPNFQEFGDDDDNGLSNLMAVIGVTRSQPRAQLP